MPVTPERLQELFTKWCNQQESPAEREELLQSIDELKLEQVSGLMQERWERTGEELAGRGSSGEQDRLAEAIYSRVIEAYPAVHGRQPAGRVYQLRKWGWAAAVILLLTGITVALILSSRRKEQPGQGLVKQGSPADINPGTNKAILRIGNDQAIDLSAEKTGIVVGKEITYNDGKRIAAAVHMLQLATPRGGQYQALLPDGSKVWLNAASSIRFPSSFNGAGRSVEVSGEVYLEIAPNSKQPFVVKARGTEIQVLGTSFNVNAYEDEDVIKTTLVEGRVRVVKDQAVTLRPGQQASVPAASGSAPEGIKVETADIEQATAWKNGLFNLNGLGVRAVMRQLARWYDVDVRYEGTVPSNIFKGKMYRNGNLSVVLEWLHNLGVECKLDGKTLIVESGN